MVRSNEVTGDAPGASALKQRKPKSAARRVDLALLESRLDAHDERMAKLEARCLSLEAFEVRK